MRDWLQSDVITTGFDPGSARPGFAVVFKRAGEDMPSAFRVILAPLATTLHGDKHFGFVDKDNAAEAAFLFAKTLFHDDLQYVGGRKPDLHVSEGQPSGVGERTNYAIAIHNNIIGAAFETVARLYGVPVTTVPPKYRADVFELGVGRPSIKRECLRLCKEAMGDSGWQTLTQQLPGSGEKDPKRDVCDALTYAMCGMLFLKNGVVPHGLSSALSTGYAVPTHKIINLRFDAAVMQKRAEVNIVSKRLVDAQERVKQRLKKTPEARKAAAMRAAEKKAAVKAAAGTPPAVSTARALQKKKPASEAKPPASETRVKEGKMVRAAPKLVKAKRSKQTKIAVVAG